VYLPVFNAGALLFFGDMHAAMGDGELTGSALETSANLEFTVDLIKGYSTGNPRLENPDYIMSVGVAGSIQDALQIATTQLAEWLRHDYKLNDNEVAVVLGTALKYDVAELVDPHFSMVAKLPRSALARLK
jgi:amidase